MPISWIATHTGLPSFYTDLPVTSGRRTLSPGGSEQMFSDALATPGSPTEYTIGGNVIELTRASQGMRFASITRPNGRGVPDLWYRDTGDPETAKPKVFRSPSGYSRWESSPVMRSGKGLFLSWDPTRIDDIWEVLLAKEPLVIAADGNVLGASPLRVVTIDSVGRQRLASNGLQSWDVAWVEHPHVGSGRAPVVTWGEWDAWGKANGQPGWRNWSYIDIARRVAGMPEVL